MHFMNLNIFEQLRILKVEYSREISKQVKGEYTACVVVNSFVIGWFGPTFIRQQCLHLKKIVFMSNNHSKIFWTP